jgi:hypothetical protein
MDVVQERADRDDRGGDGRSLLRFAHAGDWEALRDELASMERTVRASGSASYSAPANKHDDLVLALSLSIWGCRRLARPAPRRRSFGAKGRPPSPLAWT